MKMDRQRHQLRHVLRNRLGEWLDTIYRNEGIGRVEETCYVKEGILCGMDM